MLWGITKMPDCDHTIGIHWDYSDTRLMALSDYEGDDLSIDCFNYCPDCGQSLPGITE